MRPIAVALGMMLAFAAWADTGDIEFYGQRYHPAFQNNARAPDGTGHPFIEFTLPGETVENWTKLFAYHDFPDLDVAPDLAVTALGQEVKTQNKDANFALTEVPGGEEAIIDFLTWAPNSDVMEFNIFKYVRAGAGKGLIALQYAQRFKADDFDVMAFRDFRQKAVEAMAKMNAGPARSYFAAKART